MTTKTIIKQLDDWRHLVGFPLERSVSAYFALFLKDVLSLKFSTKVHSTIIPEFPLARHSPNEGRANLFYNVDYLAIASETNTAYLVELKTDMKMLRESQRSYLNTASEGSLTQLLRSICAAVQVSNKKNKWINLLHLISMIDSDLVRLSDNLYRKTFPIPRPGWSKEFKEVIDHLEQSTDLYSDLKVVFIQPREHTIDSAEDFEYIYFEEFASLIENSGKFASLFASYLRDWSSCDAGSRDPRLHLV